MKPRPNHERRRGLMLVEWLVGLIVLIAISAFVIVTIMRSRNEGRLRRDYDNRVTCLSQLKGLAMAALLYSNDNKRLPGPTFQADLHPFIMARDGLACPAFTASMPSSTLAIGPETYLRGYIYNGSEIGGRRISGYADGKDHLPRPTSEVWMFADTFRGLDSVTGYIDYSACQGKHSWSTIHKGGGNYAFVDGHVKWMRPEAMEKLTCSKSPKSAFRQPRAFSVLQ